MNPSPDWDISTPQGLENAQNWMNGVLSLLSPQAVWIVPRSGMLLALDQTTKTATILSGDWDWAILHVLLTMGWSIQITK